MNHEQAEEYERSRKRLEKYAYAVEYCNQNVAPERETEEWRKKLGKEFSKMMGIDRKQARDDFNKAFSRARKLLKLLIGKPKTGFKGVGFRAI